MLTILWFLIELKFITSVKCLLIIKLQTVIYSDTIDGR